MGLIAPPSRNGNFTRFMLLAISVLAIRELAVYVWPIEVEEDFNPRVGFGQYETRHDGHPTRKPRSLNAVPLDQDN